MSEICWNGKIHDILAKTVIFIKSSGSELDDEKRYGI